MIVPISLSGARPSDTISWYDANAASAAARSEAHSAATLNDWLIDLLPRSPGVIMDVGAASGADTAWLASPGHEVLAIEPSAGNARRSAPAAHAGQSALARRQAAGHGGTDPRRAVGRHLHIGSHVNPTRTRG